MTDSISEGITSKYFLFRQIGWLKLFLNPKELNKLKLRANQINNGYLLILLIYIMVLQ